MTGPFEALAASVGDRLPELPVRGRIAFYTAAARALYPGYEMWATASGVSSSLFDQALRLASAHAIGRGDRQASVDLLAAMDSTAPEGDSATVAQDAWICVDIALRIATEDYPSESGAWYVLEPRFQSETQKIFGVSDVGSPEQVKGESQVLESPIMVRAKEAIEEVQHRLVVSLAESQADLDQLAERLVVLLPGVQESP